MVSDSGGTFEFDDGKNETGVLKANSNSLFSNCRQRVRVKQPTPFPLWENENLVFCRREKKRLAQMQPIWRTHFIESNAFVQIFCFSYYRDRYIISSAYWFLSTLKWKYWMCMALTCIFYYGIGHDYWLLKVFARLLWNMLRHFFTILNWFLLHIIAPKIFTTSAYLTKVHIEHVNCRMFSTSLFDSMFYRKEFLPLSLILTIQKKESLISTTSLALLN